jgi:pectate lyase
MKLKSLLFFLLSSSFAADLYAANRPSGYITLCNEGKTCSVATSTNVAFGRADKFFYKTLSGTFVCSEATFGGRIAGGVNECSRPTAQTSASSVSLSSSSRSNSISSSISSSSRSSSLSSISSSSRSSSLSVSSSSRSSSSSSSRSSSLAPVVTTGVDGFAAVNALDLATTTGGAGGAVVTATNFAELNQYMDSNDTLTILVSGTIQLNGMTPLRSNKTLMGINNAKLTGGGLEMYKRSNIIIRNITFENAPDDAIKINQNSHHIWVDHCTFTDGDVADPEAANHDGLFDITRQSSYITISYNKFFNHAKTMLIGHSDSASSDVGFLKVSIHHNWFNGTASRHPRLRYGEVHVYNNYYLNNKEYGATSTQEGDLVVEGNYFQGVPFPTLVGYAESGPGDIVERYNVFVDSGVAQTRGTAFDPYTYYNYVLEDAASLPAKLTQNTGAGVIDPYATLGISR